VHGYSVAFAISAGLLALGAIVSAVFISARKTDLPSDVAEAAVA
jgi:hypothetical protein